MAVKGKGKGKEVDTASSSKRKGSSSASASKRRRSGVLKFVDDAAYVADDDEEEDDPDSEDDFEDFLDELAKEGEAPVDDPKGKGKSFLPFLVKEEDLSGDELEAIIKERYGRKSGLKYAGYEDEFKDMAGPNPTKDPTIWRLKCGVGHERQVAFCFMQKYVDFHNRGNKLQIFSAFALDHVKGYVYVEADKACDVTEACKGFCNVYITRINAVPASEVPHLLAIRSKPSVVPQGAWVRLKSGNYKGDIAQVVSLDDGRNKVLIKLIPRIDLQAISQKFGGAISLKNASGPTARLINPRELEVFRPHIELKRDRQSGVTFEVLDGNMLKDGYLYKRVALSSLIYWGVEPTDRERVQFSPPSREGQQIDPDEWISDLYDGRGRKKSRASTSADPKASASEPMDDSGFGIHDLVLFGKKDFGVILGLEKDGMYKILTGDMEGVPVVMIKRHDIKKVCADKMFTALDRNKKCLSINDPVDVSEGPSEGKKGVVKHMFKGVLFILDQNETENGGFFRAKAEHCVNTKNSEEMLQPPVQPFPENLDDNAGPSFAPSSPGLFQQDNTRGSGRRRPERDSLFSIGQTLRIRKGPLKGYLCRVVRMYRNDITVKLDSLVKILTVDAEFLTVPTKRGQADEPGAAGTSDIFGVQGSEGGSSWDATLPSFTGDTWQPFASSTAATGAGDDRAGGDGDPWGSKMPSGTTPDAWNSDKPSDTWGCASDRQAATSTPNVTWQKDDDNIWGNSSQKNVADESGWCNEKGKGAASDDPWGTMVLKGPDEGANAWCQANNAASDEPTVKSDLWDSKGKEIVTEVAGSDMWGKSKGESGSGDWNNTSSNWDAKGKGLVNEDNSAWGGKATKIQDADIWGSKSDAWGQSTVKDGGGEGGSGWNSGGKAKGNSMSNEDNTAWGQLKKDGSGESGGGWNSGGNASWDKPNASTWNSGQDDGGDKDNKPMDSWNSGGGFGGRGGRGSRGGGASGRGGGRSGGGSGDCYKCGQSGHFARECPAAGNGGGGRSGGGNGDCYKCGQSGHFARECPSAGNGGSQGGGGSCYKCGQTGHFARECPSADGSGFNSGGGGGSRSGGGSNCYKCGEGGHFARECPSAEGGGSRGGGGTGSRDCYKCGKPGHFARECPNDGGAAGGTWKSDKSEKPSFGSSWGNDHAGDNTWSKKPESWTNDSGKGWSNLQADVEKKTDLNSSSWSKDVSVKETTGGADNWNAATHAPEEIQGVDPWPSNLTPGQVNRTTNAWSASIEGKTKEHNSWNNNQKTKELDPWGGNQKTEASSSKTNEAEIKGDDPWGTQSTSHPGSDSQDDPWSIKMADEKKTAAEAGGWNAGRSGQTQSSNWGNSENDSDWSKPKVSLAGGNNDNKNDGSGWSRPSWTSDSGGRGRGRGRGRNFGDRNDNNDGSRGGRGRSFGDDNNNGGRVGNWRGRGGGRYGGSQGGRGGRDGSGGSALWNGDGNRSFGGSSWNRDDNRSLGGNSWSNNTDSKKSSEWGGGWGNTGDEKERSNSSLSFSAWNQSSIKEGSNLGDTGEEEKGKNEVEGGRGWGDTGGKKENRNSWNAVPSSFTGSQDSTEKGWGNTSDKDKRNNEEGGGSAWDKPSGDGSGGWDKGGDKGNSSGPTAW